MGVGDNFSVRRRPCLVTHLLLLLLVLVLLVLLPLGILGADGPGHLLGLLLVHHLALLLLDVIAHLLWLGDLSADGLHELLAVVGDLAVLAVVVTLLLANLLGLLHATVLVDGVEVALLLGAH